jgi:hypothetical protein
MKIVRRRLAAVAMLALCMAPLAQPAFAQQSDVETIVMVRHGEKPAGGLGQLNCQGLNRALALPRVIEARYGKPDVIFAPDPSKQKDDNGKQYDYVRPLATIEPTAIYFGLPVDTSIGFSKTRDLRTALLSAQYRRSVVVVAWEHRIIEKLARKMVEDSGGDPATVPRWDSPDFDSIYILRVTRGGDSVHVAFSIDHQGLNNQPVTCPGAS